MDKITIIFGTEMGTAAGCATDLSKRLKDCNLENEVIDMEDYDHARLSDKGLLIVAISTAGIGAPPSNARALYSHLADDKPDIAGRKFAVLSLGDSYRTPFAQCGKDFDRMLEELGGTRIIDRIDCDGPVEVPFKKFQKNLLDYFENESELYPSFTRKEEPPEAEKHTQKANPENNTSEDKSSKKRSILSRVKRRVVNKIRRLF